MREEMGMSDTLDSWIIAIKGSHAQEIAFILPKRHLTNQIHLENERNACVIHSMGTTQ